MRVFGLFFAIAFLALTIAVKVPQRPKIQLKPFVTTQERILKNGYPAESHFIETEDGYLLNVFRIPYSNKVNNSNTKKPAILLQHGFFSNSDCWLNNGPDHSLAYLLADAGYDVWLGNARGNIYSRQNTKISINHPSFWSFSWHEIGTIDIAAMIDYILQTTGETAIHYAGHSQGTTVYFVLMSERPEYNKKIKTAHMLAPCAFMGHGTSFVFKLIAPLVGTPGGIWNTLLADIELIPHNRIVNRLIDSSCGDRPYLGTKRCQNIYLWVVGDGYENMNQTGLQQLLETHPGGSSSSQGIHYMQLYVSKQFRKFDFGPKKNEQLYKRATPPDYDLSKITAPTYLYSSEKDALCGPADVDALVSKMPQLADDYRVPDKNFNHLDFICANELKELINDRLIGICNKFEVNNLWKNSNKNLYSKINSV